MGSDISEPVMITKMSVSKIHRITEKCKEYSHPVSCTKFYGESYVYVHLTYSRCGVRRGKEFPTTLVQATDTANIVIALCLRFRLGQRTNKSSIKLDDRQTDSPEYKIKYRSMVNSGKNYN
jgi:hypothetical protein